MTDRQLHLVPLMGLIMAMILWAGSFIALKIAFRSYDPMVVIFGRMFLASICFLCLYPLFRPKRLRLKDVKYMLVMTIFEPCLYFLCEAKALTLTTASQAGMITAMLPLIVALGAHLVLKEHLSGRTLTGFFVAVCGACLLGAMGESSLQAPHPFLGNTLEFAAMVCAAAYTIILKRLSSRYNPFFLTAIQAFAGSIFYLPLMCLSPTPFTGQFHPAGFLSIVYLGVCVTIGAYGLFNYGVSRIPASQAGAFVNLIPVFTLILSWIVLGESFGPLQYVASALVFAGVFLSQDRRSGSGCTTGKMPEVQHPGDGRALPH